MPYKMNPQQYESVLKLSSEDRSSHFVGKVADWEQLWGVKGDKGWLIPITDNDLEYFPVWPHVEYAQKIADEHFPGHKAVEISLEEFLFGWLPTFETDNVKVAVFPNKEWVLWIMEPSDLAECLRDEMTQYEQHNKIFETDAENERLNKALCNMKKTATCTGGILAFSLIIGASYIWYKHWIPREYVFTSTEAESGLEFLNVKREYWTPESKDILEVRKKLSQYFEFNDVPNEERMYSIESYNYQYYGYFYNGKKLIDVTAFCSGLEAFAHHDQMGLTINRPVYILDGGPCFLDAIYDVTTNEMQEVYVH